MRRTAAFLFALACTAAMATGQTIPAPQFQHARVVSSPGLATAIHAARQETQPSWVAYAVTAQPGQHSTCGVEYLEHDRDVQADAPDSSTPVNLVVLLRIANGAATRVRVAMDPHCTLDAGDLTVRWVGAVSPTESVAELTGLLDTARGALPALALSAGSEATAALIAAARHDAQDKVRGEALFWLSQRAGDQAIGVISEAVRNDPSTAVKERAVFGLSQLPDGRGVPLLIDVAIHNSNPAVRRRAMFWLGQSKDARALAFFRSILLPATDNEN